MADGDIYEFTLGMTQSGEKLVNRWNFVQNGADLALDGAQHLAETFVSVFEPVYLTAVSSDLSIQSYRIRRVLPTPGGSYLVTRDQPGLIVSDALPPNSVAVIGLYTNQGGRANRGRFHVSGQPDNGTDVCVLDEAQYNRLQDLGNLFESDQNSGAGTPSFRAVMKHATVLLSPLVAYSRVRGELFTLRSRRMENPA